MERRFRVARIEGVPDTYGVRTFSLVEVVVGHAPITVTLTAGPYQGFRDLAVGSEVRISTDAPTS